MNAYELANELSEFMTEDEYTELDKTIFKAVTMLRQQADRIAELEKQNKPIGVYDGKRVYITTPQTKPLSDEEIENIAGNCCHGATAWHSPELDIYEFARAIEERHGIK